MDLYVEWDWADWVFFVVTVVTGLAGFGIFAIFAQLRGEAIARHREFENTYVARYWEISDRLPLRLLQGYDDLNFDHLSANEKRALADYVMLIEDELDLRTQGFITKRTWRIWSSAFESTLAVPVIQTTIADFSSTRLSCILRFTSSHELDPCVLSGFKQYCRGLS